MAIAHSPAKPCPTPPVYLPIRPTDRRGGPEWWISLEDDILTLLNPAEAPILQLCRDEAARYVRLKQDLFRGQTMEFVFVGSLLQYSFRIGKEHLAVLLDWLPHKTSREQRTEIRKAGAAVALFGVVYLLLPSYLPWLWGAALLAIGALGLVLAGPRAYAAHGTTLVAAGLWSLFSWTTSGLDPRTIPWEERSIPVTAGSLLVLWGIQQFAMLLPSQQIRAACAIRDRRASFLPRESRLVRRIGLLTACAGALLALYAAVVGVFRAFWPVLPGEADTLLTDLLVSGTVATLTAVSGGMLLLRKTALYGEAKVAGQMVIVAGVFAAWTVGFGVADALQPGHAAFRGLIGPNLAAFAVPYAWLLSIPSVLLFNRWYTRAVDRELEELRD